MKSQISVSIRWVIFSATILFTAASIAGEVANIASLRISLTPHPAHDGDYYASIDLKYGIQTQTKRLKKPVVAVMIVAENSAGKRRFLPCFTCRSRLEDEFVVLGCDTSNKGLNASNFAELRSDQQAEVDAAKLRSVSISSRRVFVSSLGKSTWKILWARAEVWIDGKLIGEYENQAAQLAKKNGTLPDDWHIVNKYPDKFEYSKD